MATTETHKQTDLLLADNDYEQTHHASMGYLDENARQARRRRILRKLAARMRASYFINVGKRVGYAFVPQLIRSAVWSDHAPKIKQFPTSYLNGLRGITAIKVFTFHYLMAFTNFTHNPWAMDEAHTRFIAFPIVRYFYAGFTSQIFFACAGYLASSRLFQLLDKDDVTSQAQVLTIVAASMFRRWFRLYLPVFIITLLMTFYIYLGLYERTRPFTNVPSAFFPGPWNETKPIQLMTLTQQLGYWQQEMWQLTDITNHKIIWPEVDQHLWSIHAEMRASICLYGSLIAVACCKRWVRLICLLLLTYAFFLWDKWEIWIYILSAAVAQFDIILSDYHQSRTTSQIQLPPSPFDLEKLGSDNDTRDAISPQYRLCDFSGIALPFTLPFGTAVSTNTTNRVISLTLHKLARIVLFVLAGYLLSFPVNTTEFAPGYEWLKALMPAWSERKDKVAPNLGAALLIFLLARTDPKSSLWRKITTHPIALYLGSISFSIYLVHGPLLHMFGYMIPQRIWWALGTQGIEASEEVWVAAIATGWVTSLLVVLCAADVWKREVEERCVRAVKWLEGQCFKSKIS